MTVVTLCFGACFVVMNPNVPLCDTGTCFWVEELVVPDIINPPLPLPPRKPKEN